MYLLYDFISIFEIRRNAVIYITLHFRGVHFSPGLSRGIQVVIYKLFRGKEPRTLQ